MIKLSKITNHPVACSRILVRKSGYYTTIITLAKENDLASCKVQKILKFFVLKSDVIKSNLRAIGNYLLNRNSLEITVIEIFKALYGHIILKSCVDKTESFCESNNFCFSSEKLKKINETIRKSLNEISLEKLLNCKNPFLINYNKVTLIDKIN